jgi:hypothetical protein
LANLEPTLYIAELVQIFSTVSTMNDINDSIYMLANGRILNFLNSSLQKKTCPNCFLLDTKYFLTSIKLIQKITPRFMMERKEIK